MYFTTLMKKLKAASEKFSGKNGYIQQTLSVIPDIRTVSLTGKLLFCYICLNDSFILDIDESL